jgi:hypothetical protein
MKSTMDVGKEIRAHYRSHMPPLEEVVSRATARTRQRRRTVGVLSVALSLIALTAMVLVITRNGDTAGVETADPQRNASQPEWQQLPEVPVRLQPLLSSVIVEGQLVVMGKLADGGSVVAYSLAETAELWSELPPPPFDDLPSGYGDGRGTITLTSIDANRAVALGRVADQPGLVVSILGLANGQWSWSTPSTVPTAAEADASFAATSNEVVIWGGSDDERRAVSGGAVLDLAANEWRPIDAGPLGPRSGTRAVAVGARILLLGGGDAEREYADGAFYTPNHNEWQVVPVVADVSRVMSVISTQAGTFVVGERVDRTLVIAQYGPDGSWVALPAPPIDAMRVNAAGTSRELIVWSGERVNGTGVAETSLDGAVYDIARRTWSAHEPLAEHSGACLMATAATEHLVYAVGGIEDCGSGLPVASQAALVWES